MDVPDHLLISIDLSGAEWYCTGYLAHEKNMITVHQNRGDAHCKTGSLMTGGLSEELIKKEDKLLGKVTDPATLLKRRQEEVPELLESTASWLPSIMTIRQAGKKSNHGFNYDMRYGRFSLENLIPEGDAKKMEIQYKEVAYPGLRRRYYPSIQQELFGGEECAECGYFRYAYSAPGVLWEPLSQKRCDRPSHCEICGSGNWRERPPRLLRNCFGRAVRLLGGWGPDLYQQGYSFKPQSTVADSVKEGFCSFYEEDNPAYQKAYIWNTTHDELTVMYPIEPDLTDMAVVIIALAQDFLRPVLRYPPYEFQLDTDIKVGFRYGDPTNETKADGLIPLKFSEPVPELITLSLKESLEHLRKGWLQ